MGRPVTNHFLPSWRNWQTRMVQVHVPARVWGFESLRWHQGSLLPRRSLPIDFFFDKSMTRDSISLPYNCCNLPCLPTSIKSLPQPAEDLPRSSLPPIFANLTGRLESTFRAAFGAVWNQPVRMVWPSSQN